MIAAYGLSNRRVWCGRSTPAARVTSANPVVAPPGGAGASTKPSSRMNEARTRSSVRSDHTTLPQGGGEREIVDGSRAVAFLVALAEPQHDVAHVHQRERNGDRQERRAA